MKKFLFIELPDDDGGGGGGCLSSIIALVVIGVVLYVAISMWPKMFVELATGKSGASTAAYIVLIAFGLIPPFIVECVRKDAGFGAKYLTNIIIIALLMIVGSVLEGSFSLFMIFGAFLTGAVAALLPTVVFAWIGKAIRNSQSKK